MIKFRTGLAMVAILAAAPVGAATAPARVEVAFPSRLTARIVSHGHVYVATLTPFADAWRDVSTIDLELARPGRGRSRNLLSPPGNWHGMQWPFYFVASDLAARPGGALFPNPRNILIQGTHDALEVTVLDSRVRPTKTEMHAAFEGLRLVLVIRRQ